MGATKQLGSKSIRVVNRTAGGQQRQGQDGQAQIAVHLGLPLGLGDECVRDEGFRDGSIQTSGCITIL